MGWRQHAEQVGDLGTLDKTLDRIEPGFGPGEWAMCVFLGRRAERGRVLQVPVCAVTNERLVAASPGLFGVKSVSVRLARVSDIGVGPLFGVGPTWALVLTGDGTPMSVYLWDPSQADAVQRAVESVARLRHLGQTIPRPG